MARYVGIVERRWEGRWGWVGFGGCAGEGELKGNEGGSDVWRQDRHQHQDTLRSICYWHSTAGFGR
jgi:hypothetical protein